MTAFLSKIAAEGQNAPNKKAFKSREEILSKRWRVKYARCQRLFKKRKGAFDSLFNNNLSDSLNHQEVFDYWQHLLCHTAITDTNDELHIEKLEFDPDTLIYPDEVQKHSSRNKSTAGLDGLSVNEVLKINRIKAKLFNIFLLLQWIPDIMLNSYIIFIPKNIVPMIHLTYG